LYFVDREVAYTYEIKKSKFIAYLFPSRDFDIVMKRLRDNHPKARHFVYALRELNEFNQVVENCSDDGEPKGTSGKPSLKVLQGNELINSAVIIIRYFGGIKLGTGGLVRAYSDAVNLAIENSTLIDYKELATKKIKVDYSNLSKIEYILNESNIDIIAKEYTQDILLTLKANEESFQKAKELLPFGFEFTS
jgi:uncharacterized YigZ family protein